MRRILRAIAFWTLALGVTAVMAADTSSSQGPVGLPSWLEHWDLVQVIIGVLFAAFVWDARQRVARIDRKFDVIFEWKDQISDRVATLEAQHELRGRICPALDGTEDRGDAEHRRRRKTDRQP